MMCGIMRQSTTQEKGVSKIHSGENNIEIKFWLNKFCSQNFKFVYKLVNQLLFLPSQPTQLKTYYILL